MKIAGSNIKKLRQEKGYSLKELAERINVSASFISQVERNKISPSLGKLKNIADTLNTTVGRLMGENYPFHSSENTSPVLREEERKQSNHIGEGLSISILATPDPYRQMEPLLIKMQQNASSGEQQYQHFGQEFVLVLKGKCVITLNETKYVLNKGDSIYFNSNIPHSFNNLNKGETEVVWVVTPPSF